MKEFSNIMANCIEQASKLSDEEIISLIHFLTKQKKAREAKRLLKEKISNAIKAISALTEEFYYLETKDADGAYLADIIDGLENLKNRFIDER